MNINGIVREVNIEGKLELHEHKPNSPRTYTRTLKH